MPGTLGQVRPSESDARAAHETFRAGPGVRSGERALRSRITSRRFWQEIACFDFTGDPEVSAFVSFAARPAQTT